MDPEDELGFFSPEAGQARTRALNEFLDGNLDYYLGPTGIPDRLRLLNEFLNPVAGIRESQAQAMAAMDPERSTGDRLAAAGTSALGAGLAGIPALMANRGYIPNAEAIQELFAGIATASPSATEMARQAIERLNQPGPMPTLYSNPLPGVGDNGGPPLVDATQEPGSRVLRGIQQVPQERGTYGQLRQALIRAGGGDPAERELFFTGADRMFAPDDRITRQQLEDYLTGVVPRMFGTETSRATGVLGQTDDIGDLRIEARLAFEGTPDAQTLREDVEDEVRRQFAQDYSPSEYSDENVQEAADVVFEDRLQDMFDFMPRDDLYAYAGVGPSFDPGDTSYSSYFTPGLTNYFETRYAFLDPSRVSSAPPGRPSGYGSASSHWDADPNTPLVHVRGATASAMGGRDNAYHIGEIQSDLGQGIQQGRVTAPVETPEVAAVNRLTRLDELTPAEWRQVQRSPMWGQMGYDNWYETRFRAPTSGDREPGPGEFLNAADNSLGATRERLMLAAQDAAAEAREARDPLARARVDLYEAIHDEDPSFLGFDDPRQAQQALVRELTVGGSSPRDVFEMWDLSPEDNPRIRDVVQRMYDDGLVSQDYGRRMSELGERAYRLEQEARNFSVVLDGNGIVPLSRLTQVDIPVQFQRRLDAGEFLSQDEIDEVAQTFGAMEAAAINMRQEFLRRGVNPEVVRDFSGLSRSLSDPLYDAPRSAVPFVESTNQWVDYALRQQLFEAAQSGQEYVTLSNPEMVRAMTYGSEEGQGQFYGAIVPQRLRHILRRLDRNLPMTTSADEFQNNQEMILGPGTMDTDNGPQEVLTLRMTPQLRAMIIGDESQGYPGLTTFMRPEAAVAAGGLAALAAANQEQE
jgi:hypothetical protein